MGLCNRFPRMRKKRKFSNSFFLFFIIEAVGLDAAFASGWLQVPFKMYTGTTEHATEVMTLEHEMEIYDHRQISQSSMSLRSRRFSISQDIDVRSIIPASQTLPDNAFST